MFDSIDDWLVIAVVAWRSCSTARRRSRSSPGASAARSGSSSSGRLEVERELKAEQLKADAATQGGPGA